MKHENIVNLLDVFRRKGKIYLVMEHVDRAILADLEKNPSGLSDHREHGMGRRYMWQLLRAMDYLHKNNVSFLTFDTVACICCFIFNWGDG